jgi:phosphohistidine phosphatase
MELYLVQHGESKRESDDPARPLTDRGRTDVERVARYAARLRLDVEDILHSGKLRTQQTAEILAEHLMPARGPSEMPGLAPGDDPTGAAGPLSRASVPTMVVGHLPHLSRLLSLLVSGDSVREIVAFHNGGIVRLTTSQDAGAAGGWRVRWILTPELAQD